MFAPEAESVKVTGDFLPEVKLKWEHGEAMVAGEAELERKENGVWEFRSEPLKSELYFYSFIVDGMRGASFAYWKSILNTDNMIKKAKLKAENRPM